MKKIKYRILLMIIIVAFMTFVPNFSKAASVSVGKVKNAWAGTTTTSKIKVKWKKVKNATGYRVYKYNSSKNKYETYGSTSNTSLKVKNLKSSTKYKFKVRAYISKNGKKFYGVYSPIITAATSPKKVKGIKVNGQAEETIFLSWNKVTRATGYKVYVFNSSSKKYESKVSTSNNNAKITGLNSGSTYSFKVRAYKKANNKKFYGVYSNIVYGKTTPSKVTGLKAYDYTLNSISLSWNNISSKVTYRVYLYNKSKKTYESQGDTKNTYFKVKGLSAASEYTFKVRAFIIINGKKYFGAYSNALNSGTCPNKATGFKITKTTTDSIEVSWDKVKQADGYAVYVYRESYQSFRLYKSTTSTSMKIKDLRAAKFYKMYVKAYTIINGVKYYSAESTIISQKTNSTDKYKAGIDVSQHQETIDWEKVKRMGVDFAIIRLGWIGNKQNHKLDTYFERNYSECKRLGIPVGVYIYCYSNSVKHIKEGAEWTVKKLKGKTTELPVFIDMEDSSIIKAGKKELSKMCVEFNTIIEKAGFKAGIYANRYWFDTYLEKDLRTKYTCWIAHYTSSSSINYEDTFTIWQYSSAGKVNGINGNADLNIMYVKEEEIEPQDPPTPAEPEEPSNPEPDNPSPDNPNPDNPNDPNQEEGQNQTGGSETIDDNKNG